MTAEREREALRQQMMLRAVWRDSRPGVLAGWTRDGSRFERGLLAYQANAGALAERALAAAYPTVQQLISDESFAVLARVYWRHAPPLRGDIATWGETLADFIAADEQLAPEAYLPDLARLEWAVHQAHGAGDAAPGEPALQRLADTDPDRLRLMARPGTAVIDSAHPVVAIWQAHRSHAADRFDAVQEALADGRGECALVWRQGWTVAVAAVPEADRRVTALLLGGASLGAALAAADPTFDFEGWLVAALQQGWLAGAELLQKDSQA